VLAYPSRVSGDEGGDEFLDELPVLREYGTKTGVTVSHPSNPEVDFPIGGIEPRLAVEEPLSSTKRVMELCSINKQELG
jgi:hypothetical protein